MWYMSQFLNLVYPSWKWVTSHEASVVSSLVFVLTPVGVLLGDTIGCLLWRQALPKAHIARIAQ